LLPKLQFKFKNERIENVALSHFTLWIQEIVNTRFTDYGDAINNVADYIDIRDDRTNFYFGAKPMKIKHSECY
jgi:hypothetical protein